MRSVSWIRFSLRKIICVILKSLVCWLLVSVLDILIQKKKENTNSPYSSQNNIQFSIIHLHYHSASDGAIISTTFTSKTPNDLQATSFGLIRLTSCQPTLFITLNYDDESL